MGLVTTKEMFQKAYEGGYAIGAFNVNNMEIVQGITEAAGAPLFACDPPGIKRRPGIRQPHLPCETGGGRPHRK